MQLCLLLRQFCIIVAEYVFVTAHTFMTQSFRVKVEQLSIIEY